MPELSDMKDEIVQRLTKMFMDGRHDQLLTEMRILRPDLSSDAIVTELCLVMLETVTKAYKMMQTTVKEAVIKIDTALLNDPAPLSDYAVARDLLNKAVSKHE